MDEDIDGAEYAIFDDFGGIKFPPKLQILVRTPETILRHGQVQRQKLVHWARPQFGYLTPTHATNQV